MSDVCIFIYSPRIVTYYSEVVFHRKPEHLIGDEIKCTLIYLCPCVFFSRLEGIRMTRRWFTFRNIISRAAL